MDHTERELISFFRSTNVDIEKHWRDGNTLVALPKGLQVVKISKILQLLEMSKNEARKIPPRMTCPRCGNLGIYYRSKKLKNWRCKVCNFIFTTPINGPLQNINKSDQ